MVAIFPPELNEKWLFPSNVILKLVDVIKNDIEAQTYRSHAITVVEVISGIHRMFLKCFKKTDFALFHLYIRKVKTKAKLN